MSEHPSLEYDVLARTISKISQGESVQFPFAGLPFLLALKICALL